MKVILCFCLSQHETKEHDEKEGESEDETTGTDSDVSTVDDEESITGDVITLQGK